MTASDDETTGSSPLRDGFIAHGKLTYNSLVMEREHKYQLPRGLYMHKVKMTWLVRRYCQDI